MPSLAAQTQSELRMFGFDGRDIELLYRLDMRYRGQDDTITVPLETGWVARPADPSC